MLVGAEVYLRLRRGALYTCLDSRRYNKEVFEAFSDALDFLEDHGVLVGDNHVPPHCRKH